MRPGNTERTLMTTLRSQVRGVVLSGAGPLVLDQLGGGDRVGARVSLVVLIGVGDPIWWEIGNRLARLVRKGVRDEVRRPI